MGRSATTDKIRGKPTYGALTGNTPKPVGKILVGLLVLSLLAYGGHILMTDASLDGFDFSVEGME